ncbi:NAD(P)/FAD-dependent oxidoreductase [Palleronia rufa]|uniref:NAD(P)/FAD-dependent oxidoreductase n=1 Tax=Palleronia rufa TaxID=1530186 RepID=UPI000565149C|nr:FAD-dependent oxidoreductase [Palleronia rufa]
MASDVTIRGAGIYGLSVAWECLARGARVRLVDPAGPAGGASGGVVGALAPHTPGDWSDIKALQLDTLLAAPEYWAEVAEAGGGDSGYARTGRLQSLPDDAAVVRARARAADAHRHWGDAFRWEVVAAPSGWGPESPTGLVVHDTLSARLHPARATLALAAAVRARGVAVLDDAPDRGPTVWATGAAGLEALSRALGREVGRGIKGQGAVLSHHAPDMPQIYTGGVHMVPHADGTVGIGSTTEREFDSPDTTDAGLEAVIAAARAAVPALREAAVLRRWAGVRPRARSRQPLLGAWPGRAGHFVANGGFKIGFGTHFAAARMVADLVLDGVDRIPPSMRLER